MTQTYTERSNSSDLSTYNDGSSGTIKHRLALQTTQIAGSNLTSSLAANATDKEIFITQLVNPNELDWDGGSYTVNFNVVTAATNAGTAIIEVILARISSDGTSTRATLSSGVISISITTTGLKTQVLTWNDGTQNPVTQVQSDRLAVILRIQNGSASLTDSYTFEVNSSTNSETVVTPLVPNSISVKQIMPAANLYLYKQFIRRWRQRQMIKKRTNLKYGSQKFDAWKAVISPGLPPTIQLIAVNTMKITRESVNMI